MSEFSSKAGEPFSGFRRAASAEARARAIGQSRVHVLLAFDDSGEARKIDAWLHGGLRRATLRANGVAAATDHPRVGPEEWPSA